jgi:hypothetical protein
MGKLEEYINSLEGQDDLSIESVVSEMLNIHNGELGTANAKIETLNSQITDKDNVIRERDAEITEVKSKNWDLVNQLPAEDPTPKPVNNGDGKPDAAQITIDDLFEK